MNDIKMMTNRVRQTAYETHVYFKHGFLEKVYENALANRLRKKGFKIQQQVELPVCDEDGTVVGKYVGDIIVNESILIELKACRELDNTHTAQILAYLKTTGLRHGLLINFGAPIIQVKKYIL